MKEQNPLQYFLRATSSAIRNEGNETYTIYWSTFFGWPIFPLKAKGKIQTNKKKVYNKPAADAKNYFLK